MIYLTCTVNHGRNSYMPLLSSFCFFKQLTGLLALFARFCIFVFRGHAHPICTRHRTEALFLATARNPPVMLG